MNLKNDETIFYLSFMPERRTENVMLIKNVRNDNVLRK